MTLRSPAKLIDAEPLSVVKTFDPAKRYRFTWPGQPSREVDGAELTELCKGADPAMLAIVETGAAPPAPVTTPASVPEVFSSRPTFREP